MTATTAFRTLLAALAALSAFAWAGCGTVEPKGTVVTGPGVRASAPPWPPQYAHLRERIVGRGLPFAGSERFHIHALLHVYNDGLLVTVPPNVGLDYRDHVESSLHTHDPTGIVHMEAPRPHRYTVGDFFAIWGVRLAANELGSLHDGGGKRVYAYVNGRPISDPAAWVMHNNDNIVIAYGTADSFPRRPSTALLREVEGKGGGALSCSSAPGKKATSCTTPNGGGSR